MRDRVAGRGTAEALGICSPNGWATEGPGEGAATGVQGTPRTGGQTPALRRGEQVIQRCSGLHAHALAGLKTCTPEGS